MSQESKERYSVLAPLSLGDEFRIADHALGFFNPSNREKVAAVLKTPFDPKRATPFSVFQLIKYMGDSRDGFDSFRYSGHIARVVKRLHEKRLLQYVGQGQGAFHGESYYTNYELTSIQKKGTLWLSAVLGLRHLAVAFERIVVRLTGRIHGTEDPAVGTGLVCAPGWIVTCGHNLSRMSVTAVSSIGGAAHKVLETKAHDKIDIGFLRTDSDLLPPPDLAFSDPMLFEEVLLAGFPRVPMSRPSDSSNDLIYQKGEVVNEDITSLLGQKLFLFSAIARPGNSGGPILGSSGRVVGIVTEHLTSDEMKSEGVLPFYAGVPTAEIVEAARSLGVAARIQIERFE